MFALLSALAALAAIIDPGDIDFDWPEKGERSKFDDRIPVTPGVSQIPPDDGHWDISEEDDKRDQLEGPAAG